MIAIVVTLIAQPGRAEELRAALAENAAASPSEEGCHLWEFSRHIEDDHKFAIYELYTDMEAVQTHFDSPHFARWKSVSADLIAEKISGKYEVESA